MARSHPEVGERVRAQREQLAREVEAKDAALQERLGSGK